MPYFWIMQLNVQYSIDSEVLSTRQIKYFKINSSISAYSINFSHMKRSQETVILVYKDLL